MLKHENRVKTIASAANGSLLILRSYGGETLVCYARILAVELKGKLPALGSDINQYRGADSGLKRREVACLTRLYDQLRQGVPMDEALWNACEEGVSMDMADLADLYLRVEARV